jgi:hypothetical protein
LILSWADAEYELTGQWPRCQDGTVPANCNETWINIDYCLRHGCRGLPGGDSLPQLLARKRGARNIAALPDLTEKQIVRWARAHYKTTGKWPDLNAGLIPGPREEDWWTVNRVLREGGRGLPGGDTLARLLARRFGVRSQGATPPLTTEQILAWADAWFKRTGQWPQSTSGAIAELPGETWRRVDTALKGGLRGLAGGSSLSLLLVEQRGFRSRSHAPPLTTDLILQWADAHHERTGRWPGQASGPIVAVPEETWATIESALRTGGRGLAGGSSLACLLEQQRGVRNLARLPRLTPAKILRWADAFHRRTGRWPTRKDTGPIPEAPGETWGAVHAALLSGGRGLRGGGSLSQLLQRQRGVQRIGWQRARKSPAVP